MEDEKCIHSQEKKTLKKCFLFIKFIRLSACLHVGYHVHKVSMKARRGHLTPENGVRDGCGAGT